MTHYEYRHEFYLDYDSHPIVLNTVLIEEYRAVEMRVESRYDAKEGIETVTFKHRVEAIT